MPFTLIIGQDKRSHSLIIQCLTVKITLDKLIFMVFLWNLKNNIICLSLPMHLVVFIDVDLETLNKKTTQSFFWHFFLTKLITSVELV